jgi:two-component system, OmpR family, phosphate regulon sensor histidine kinase PhoR
MSTPPLEPQTLASFSDKLSTPVLILDLSKDGKLSLAHANDAFTALIGALPEEFALNKLLEVDAKTPYPLTQSGPVYPLTPIPTLSGLLNTQDSKQVRVKLKHDWLAPQQLWLWVEPFAEDIALTQAHADFVSVVSHEFRTPLTSIKGFADTLLRYGGNLDAEQQKRFINIIKHQADRLTRLVENLLTVSKLGAERAQFSFRAISLGKVVDRINQTIEAKTPEPRTFNVTIPEKLPDVWADPDKLEQVLTNLIDNAVKYSYAHSTVHITAQADPNDDDKIRIDITDEGVGIPAEHLPKIFSKFSRIDNPLTREVEGTGLGLFITKSLTVAMGGDIHVSSEENKGTTFTVTLPIATPERQLAENMRETSSEPEAL